MNDIIPNVKITGNIQLDGQDIYDSRVDVNALGKK
jgi:phosphate transport system ATP-binding protein